MRRNRRTVLLGLASASLVAACDPRSPPPPKPPLRLAIDLWAGYFPALLADELGYFRDAGLLVEVSIPGNTDRMMAEFIAGRYDLVALALADLINMTRSGHDVQVVLQSDESAGGDKLVVRPGFDLRAPRLVAGTNLGGFGELFVREFLVRHGVDLQRVAWVNIDAADVAAAMRKREIDIGHSWDPYVAAALADGAQTVFSSAETPGLVPDVVAGRRAVIDARREEFRAFVKAWFRAQDWWRAHADEGNAKLAARLKQTPQWVAEALSGVRLVNLDQNRGQLGIGGAEPGMTAVLNRYSDFFVAHGTLTRPVKAQDVLRNDLLP
jgi:NitT/TauT family transport system substrate-binding protein